MACKLQNTPLRVCHCLVLTASMIRGSADDDYTPARFSSNTLLEVCSAVGIASREQQTVYEDGWCQRRDADVPIQLKRAIACRNSRNGALNTQLRASGIP